MASFNSKICTLKLKMWNEKTMWNYPPLPSYGALGLQRCHPSLYLFNKDYSYVFVFEEYPQIQQIAEPYEGVRRVKKENRESKLTVTIPE